MADRNINEITISEAEQGECSDPTVEIKIKTLDSQTYTLRVNKCVPVPALKEQIATVTGVLSEQQRLICRGKVLKDDQLLSAYHVEDGHTLHLVVRQPLQQPPSSMTGNGGSDGRAEPPGSDPTSGSSRNRSGHVSSSVVLGTFNVGDQGDGSMPDLNRIVSSLLNTVGIGSVVPISAGIGNGSTIAQGGGIEVQERGTDAHGRSDANPMQSDHLSDVHIDPVHGPFRFSPAFLPRPFNQSTVIPDSLTTLSQYINHMRHEFALHGSENQSQPTSQSSEAEALGSSSDLPSVSEGLPTPAALGTVIRHTQQLLTNQAGSSLSQLARQLENEATVSDPVARNEIQIAATQSGIMMQNLGALLLELGRTTMTLRMGHSSAGSVVNAGPAVFISTTGPNPLMVQALPFQPASSFGAIPVGATHPTAASIGGTVGTGDVLRNIDIHIRTGASVASASSSEQGERGSVQQVEGQGNQVGSAQGGVFSRHGVSSVGESGAVRVVPVRTVVAVPAAINGRSSNESSGSNVGVFYPLLARFQQLNPLQLTQMRGVPQTHLSGIHSRSADTPQQHPLHSESLPTIRAHVQMQASMPTAGQNARSQEEVEQTNSSADAGLMQSQAGSITEQGIPQQGSSSMHVYSIHLGTRNRQGDNEQSNGGRSVSEGSSLAQLPTGLGQIISGMVSEGSSGTARGETVDIMSQILHNSPRSDITGPAVVHIGSHAGLTNVIEQAMQNPFSSSGLHVIGHRGVRSQNLSEMNSGSHGNHGMVDLSGVMQHLMPSVSQVLRRESEASAPHQGAEAGPRASTSEGPSSSSNGEAHPHMSTSSEGQCAAERNGAEVRKARSDIDGGNVNGDFEHDAERQQPDHSDDSYPGGSPASKRQRTQ